jgi:HPt (histidine-containing phosphotransfer) domain-containing protein
LHFPKHATAIQLLKFTSNYEFSSYAFSCAQIAGKRAMDQIVATELLAARSPRLASLPVTAILDVAHLRVYTAGDVAFEREIIGLFAGELPKTMASLEAADTPRAWHMAAHTLKGSALGVGAFALADAARAAESLKCRAHPSAAAAIEKLHRAIADVIVEAQRLRLL